MFTSSCEPLAADEVGEATNMAVMAAYLRERGLAPEPVRLVDVGAAPIEQPDPYELLKRQRLVSTTAFEPDPAAAAALRVAAAPGDRIHETALGDGAEWTFHHCASSYCSSLFPPDHEVARDFAGLGAMLAVEREERIATARLDDVLGEEALRVDALKLDCQGAELAILTHAERALAAAFLIQVEVEFLPLYRGQPLFADVDRFLRQRDYQFFTFLGFGAQPYAARGGGVRMDKGSQLLWADAIYIRAPEAWDAFDAARAAKFALVAADVYARLDLANRALERLERLTGRPLARGYFERRQAAG